jgi:hypothetical protein
MSEIEMSKILVDNRGENGYFEFDNGTLIRLSDFQLHKFLASHPKRTGGRQGLSMCQKIAADMNREIAEAEHINLMFK